MACCLGGLGSALRQKCLSTSVHSGSCPATSTHSQRILPCPDQRQAGRQPLLEVSQHGDAWGRRREIKDQDSSILITWGFINQPVRREEGTFRQRSKLRLNTIARAGKEGKGRGEPEGVRGERGMERSAAPRHRGSRGVQATLPRRRERLSHYAHGKPLQEPSTWQPVQDLSMCKAPLWPLASACSPREATCTGSSLRLSGRKSHWVCGCGLARADPHQ